MVSKIRKMTHLIEKQIEIAKIVRNEFFASKPVNVEGLLSLQTNHSLITTLFKNISCTHNSRFDSCNQ